MILPKHISLVGALMLMMVESTVMLEISRGVRSSSGVHSMSSTCDIFRKHIQVIFGSVNGSPTNYNSDGSGNSIG